MASFLYERHERKKSWKISSGFKLTFHQKWHSMVEAKVKIWPTRFQLDDAFRGLPKIFLLRCPDRNEAIYALTLSLFVTADQFKNFVFLPLPAYFPLINICAIWIEIIAGLNVTTFMWNWPIDLCQIGRVTFWQKLPNTYFSDK